MSKKLRLALIGCGNFAQRFVELFVAHPYVESLVVCDRHPEKAQDYSKRFGVDIIGTFEEALENPDIDCIINFTQRHLHGDIVIRALKAGKHVYSAVPMASSVEDCQEIVRLVKETGLIYMMGETCYYYPCAMFCRETREKGIFGDIEYGASQYYHHIDSISYGKRPGEGGMPPMFYPTHSTGMILSAAGSYATEVVCMGYQPKSEKFTDRFSVGRNYWDNLYSNQYSLMRLASGAVVRVTEARTHGWIKPSSYISALYGTDAGYEFSNAQHILVRRVPDAEPERVILEDMSYYVNTDGMVANKDMPDFKQQVANGAWQGNNVAEVQRKELLRLPDSFLELPDGHMASHKLLVDDFCKAAYRGVQPILNACTAARYTIPGLLCVQSANEGGTKIEVPDCGEMECEHA